MDQAGGIAFVSVLILLVVTYIAVKEWLLGKDEAREYGFWRIIYQEFIRLLRGKIDPSSINAIGIVLVFLLAFFYFVPDVVDKLKSVIYPPESDANSDIPVIVIVLLIISMTLVSTLIVARHQQKMRKDK